MTIVVVVGTALLDWAPHGQLVARGNPATVIEQLPTTEPLTVVQISDVHTSEHGPESVEVAERILATLAPIVAPNAVVITGDLTDNKFGVWDTRQRGAIDVEWQRYDQAIAAALKALPDHTQLVDMTGNHDRFGGGFLQQARSQQSTSSMYLRHGVAAVRNREMQSKASSNNTHAPTKSQEAVKLVGRHRFVDVTAADDASSLRLIALDATVDPAPTRHFFGFAGTEDIESFKNILQRGLLPGTNSTPTHQVVAAHYPLSTIAYRGQTASTRTYAGSIHPLARAMAASGVTASLSGHLHQLPMGEVSRQSRLGRPLHGVVTIAQPERHAGAQSAFLELELPDTRRHRVFRLMVLEADGAMGMAEPRAALISPQRDPLSEKPVSDSMIGRILGWFERALRLDFGSSQSGQQARQHDILADSSHLGELPLLVVTSPTDARYLSGGKSDSVALLATQQLVIRAAAWSDRPIVRAWAALHHPTGSGHATETFLSDLELRPLSDKGGPGASCNSELDAACRVRVEGLLPAAAVDAIRATAQQRRPPTLWEILVSPAACPFEPVMTLRPNVAPRASRNPENSQGSSESLPWTAAPGFSVLQVSVMDELGRVSHSFRPVSLDGVSATLPWQAFAQGDLRSTIDMAAGRALALILVFWMGAPVFLRCIGAWTKPETARPPGHSHSTTRHAKHGVSVLDSVMVMVWGPTDSLWRHFPFLIGTALLWCLYMLVGPWCVGEILPGQWVWLFSWGHLAVFQPGELQADAGGAADSVMTLPNGQILGVVWHLDSGIYLVQAYMLVVAPILAIYGMGAATVDGERDRIQRQLAAEGDSIIRRLLVALWQVTLGGIGGVSRPCSVTGVALLTVAFVGVTSLIATLSTHHGPVAAITSFGIGWPAALGWIVALWMVIQDMFILAQSVLFLPSGSSLVRSKPHKLE